jgi:hypothetical protein
VSGSVRGERALQRGDALALRTDAQLAVVVDAGDQARRALRRRARARQLSAHALDQHQRGATLRLEAQPDAEAELGVVLEQAVGPRGPRPSAFTE